MLKPYTAFVTKVLECIFSTFPTSKDRLKLFAEWKENRQNSCEEYAVLRNENAAMFYAVIQKNQELLEVVADEYEPKASKLKPEELRLVHSCYPKNQRRWLKGTVSRKKQCRVELCVLVYCHAMGWSMDTKDSSEIHAKCRQQLVQICNSFLEETTGQEFSLELLWNASCAAYQKSIGRK